MHFDRAHGKQRVAIVEKNRSKRIDDKAKRMTAVQVLDINSNYNLTSQRHLYKRLSTSKAILITSEKYKDFLIPK